MKKVLSFFIACSLLFTLSFMLLGCGGGGSAHGATDPTNEIEVINEVPTLRFPNGTEGGLDTLSKEMTRLKVEHNDSLSFIDDPTGYSWIVQTIKPETRAVATIRSRKIIHLTRHQTRSAGRFNVLLTIFDTAHNAEAILITDSAESQDLIAVGFSTNAVVTDSAATEADLSRVIGSYLPQGSPPSIEETSAIACLEGFYR